MTIRDLRLIWDTRYDCDMDNAYRAPLDWDNAIIGDSYLDNNDHIHQALIYSNDSVVYREISDLTVWDSAWTTLISSGITAFSHCRLGIYAESSSYVTIFYADAGNIYYVHKGGGGWGSQTSCLWTGGAMTGCGLAAIDNETVYAYVERPGISGHRLYRGYEAGPSNWTWEAGPHIFTGKGQGNLYAETHISAVALDGTEYIVVADHDDGRAVLVKYTNAFSDPVSILPIDIVSDPQDETIPNSQFRPYALSVVNGQLVLTGRLIRPGSDSFDLDCEVYLRGDGEHWTLDRHHVIQNYGSNGDNADNALVGAKMYQVGNYVYLVSTQMVLRAEATNLVGVDAASKKLILTDDIINYTFTHPATNAAGNLTTQIAGGSITAQDTRIRSNAEITLEAGWDNGVVSDYVQVGKFGIDTVAVSKAYGEDKLAVSARTAAMKKLNDWRAAQAYDYFSQCKIHEDFNELGGYTEWNSGWKLVGGAITGTALTGIDTYLASTAIGCFTSADTPECAIDTTDWSTLGGVLIKTQFMMVGGAITGQALYGPGIMFNATDEDYQSLVEFSSWIPRFRMFVRRDGVWEAAAVSEVIGLDSDVWWDMAVLDRAGTTRVFYKAASDYEWIECGEGFPYEWDKDYPAIEGEVYYSSPDYLQAVGSRYAADEGYVGLRAFCRTTSTTLNQELWNPDRGEDDQETIVVASVASFPSSGFIQIGDEVIAYTSVNTAQLSTQLRAGQGSKGDENIETDDREGWPGHGVFLIDSEYIEYSRHYDSSGSSLPMFRILERGAGGTTPASHADNAYVYLDNGTVRDCTDFFKVEYFEGTADSGSDTKYLYDAAQPWGSTDIEHYRIELTLSNGSTEIREVDTQSGTYIWPTKEFSESPSGLTYAIRGRGAYSTTPTTHADDTLVSEWIDAPIRFNFVDVYSLGRNYTVDYLLRDIAFRAGVTEFSEEFFVSGGGLTGTTEIVEEESYRNILMTNNAGFDQGSNCEITLDISANSVAGSGFGIVFSTTDNLVTGEHLAISGLAGESTYEIKMDNNNGTPFLQTIYNGSAHIFEKTYIDSGLSLSNTWRISLYDDHYSVWCGDRLLWSFYQPGLLAQGNLLSGVWVYLRLYNYSDAFDINYTYTYAIPDMSQIVPWYGYISGASAAEAMFNLIKNRGCWLFERNDEDLVLSELETHTSVGELADMTTTVVTQDDRNMLTAVLTTSEEWGYYADWTNITTEGFRFAEISNPALDTERDCYRAAEKHARAARELSTLFSGMTTRARLEIETEDYFMWDDEYYIVSNLTLNYGIGVLSQNIAARSNEDQYAAVYL